MTALFEQCSNELQKLNTDFRGSYKWEVKVFTEYPLKCYYFLNRLADYLITILFMQSKRSSNIILNKKQLVAGVSKIYLQ